MANKLTVVGLGPGSLGALSLDSYNALISGDKLLLRTEKHPCVNKLKELGINYLSFDYLYETADCFEQVYQTIVQQVINACGDSDVVYAVPGHPWVGEATVALLLKLAEKRSIKVQFTSSTSFLDELFTSLRIDPCTGLKIIDALNLSTYRPSIDTGNLIMQVHNRLVAGDLKLRLMETYPDDFPIWVIRAAGVEGEERKVQIPLYELDRLDWIDYLTSVYLPAYPEGRESCRYPLDRLVDVMAKLRSPNGCPWDKEQTHVSLIPYLLEEAYEVIDAIRNGNSEQLSDELGDLLLQVVFHTQLASESAQFDFNDVVEKIVAKMVRRHPHVFGAVNVENTAQVLLNWDSIKQQEQQDASGQEQQFFLRDLPQVMPALMRAYKIQAKAAQVGFDWDSVEQVWSKVEEELEELKQAYNLKNKDEVSEELGDLFFALVNLARFLDVHPELALTDTINKFIARFHYIEIKAQENGESLRNMSLARMDKLWEEAKLLKKILKKQEIPCFKRITKLGKSIKEGLN